MQETKSRPAFYVFMYVYMCVCVPRSRFTCTHTRITKGPGSSRGTLVTLSISVLVSRQPSPLKVVPGAPW